MIHNFCTDCGDNFFTFLVCGRYCADNPGLFKNADTAYVLAYAVIMLNTDAHNPIVWPKMSKSDFIRMNAMNDAEECAPTEMLEDIYDSIVKEEIKMKDESVIGANEKDTPKGKIQMKGILFDKYYKIPKPKGNKLLVSWKPDYLQLLKDSNEEFNLFVNHLLAINLTSSSKNPLVQMGWRLDRALSSQGAPCSICGSYDDIQMHHINPMSNIKSTKNVINKYKSSMERKQIPLCRKHHLFIHKGNWRNNPMKPSTIGEPSDG